MHQPTARAATMRLYLELRVDDMSIPAMLEYIRCRSAARIPTDLDTAPVATLVEHTRHLMLGELADLSNVDLYDTIRRDYPWVFRECPKCTAHARLGKGCIGEEAGCDCPRCTETCGCEREALLFMESVHPRLRKEVTV